MEIEELCSINISPLVTSPFATQWSPDNQISIITDGGAHVFELIPSPMSPNSTIKFARSFIYPSESLPTFVNKMESLIWNLEREDIYSILMEETVTPMLDGINDMINRILNLMWSPKNLISPSQCVLAILTAAGTVDLLHKVSNQWYSICDVSSLRLKYMEDKIISNLKKCKKSNRYGAITGSMRELQACAIIWSELFKVEETSFAYFSVAYCNGDILIWKIPRISNFTESLLPVLIGKIDLNIIVKINVLCWITINMNEHLLVIGYFDGQICGVKLTCDNDLQVVSIEKYVSSNHIKINYLHIVSQNESIVKILATKGPFLLLLCINLTGTLKSVQHLQVQGLSISGLISIAAEQFLITTQDNQFFIVDIQSNNLMIVDIKNNLPQTSVQSLGLAHSSNKVMFINVTSPKAIYDHLVIREPSVVHIFTLNNNTIYDPWSIINNSTNLISIWDCMEVLRLKATKAEDPSTVLRLTTEKLESFSLYNLQLSMWITVMINVCTTKKPMVNINHIKECKITRTLPLIFLYSACKFLDNSMKKSKLSKSLTHAMSLLRRYLGVYLTDKNVNENVAYRHVRKIMNATASCFNETEKCNLCGEAIVELWNVKSCPQGHKLPRCAATLLQITLLEYYVCPICAQIFHPCLKEMYEEPQCQFCDMPILRNSYAFDVEESKLYGRNMSQQRIVDIMESSKELNSEESHENQRKNKWDTIHTYSVIVNNDDDESGRITEKWEKF